MTKIYKINNLQPSKPYIPWQLPKPEFWTPPNGVSGLIKWNAFVIYTINIIEKYFTHSFIHKAPELVCSTN
jgi:hypothetical protein